MFLLLVSYFRLYGNAKGLRPLKEKNDQLDDSVIYSSAKQNLGPLVCRVTFKH